ncbi:procathepsin L-like [Physella acuta]|uniref:procathepsin L-like n=1 Tax=Physella acuta TaxID=109671 RepID=UPI0027DC4B08|nr:procathepsin L-like [Physella acuta]
MLKFVIFAAVICVVVADVDSDWLAFKSRFNKDYQGAEDVRRRNHWQQSVQTIAAHNKLYEMGRKSFFLKENEYADLSDEEYNTLLKGLIPNMTLTSPQLSIAPTSLGATTLPSTVDWRNSGYVTPVKNQGACGSCWAFSATGAIEGQLAKTTGQLVSLSESNLVDCSRPWGNSGCNGGWMNYAFQYVKDNGGIDTEASYPYVASDRACAFNQTTVGATVSSYVNVARGSESALLQAVATIGPISVAIDASKNSFRYYGGGIYNDRACSASNLNHAVLAVGYGTSATNVPFWTVKNSWGTSWGMSGYIFMSRNKKNQCGIATAASYPLI